MGKARQTRQVANSSMAGLETVRGSHKWGLEAELLNPTRPSCLSEMVTRMLGQDGGKPVQITAQERKRKVVCRLLLDTGGDLVHLLPEKLGVFRSGLHPGSTLY